MHRFLLHNGQIRESSAILLSPGQVGLMNGWGVFSTVRVVEGVLFAFERHYRRMCRDAALMRIPFPASFEEIESPLLELVEANGACDATLRVIVVRNRGGIWEGPAVERDFDLIAFTTGLKEWGAGVRLGIVRSARMASSPFAGTKILSWSHNLTWLEEAQNRGLDEVILLNERGEVSECTSVGNQIWTPPARFGVFAGHHPRIASPGDPRTRNLDRRENPQARRPRSGRRSLHHLHHAWTAARARGRRAFHPPGRSSQRTGHAGLLTLRRGLRPGSQEERENARRCALTPYKIGVVPSDPLCSVPTSLHAGLSVAFRFHR